MDIVHRVTLVSGTANQECGGEAMTTKPTVTVERAGTGADGHARAIFRLPDGRQLTVVVEPEGNGSVTWPNGIITELTPPALLPDMQVALNHAFPLAHRTDLPQHEREISAESLAALDLGIAQVKAGQTVKLDVKGWTLGARCVACPECLAPVGEVCRRSNGKLEPGHRARPHSLRRRLAKELP